MDRIVTSRGVLFGAGTGAVLLALTGCAPANNLLPAANQHLPRGMAAYQQSVEINQRNISAELNQAIRTEETVVATDPGYANGYIRLAGLFLKAGQPSAALAALKRACQVKPGDAAHWVVLGQAQAAYGTPQNAVNAYRRALSINPGQWIAWDGLGFVAVTQGHLSQASQDAQRAFQAGGPQGPTYDLMGRILLEKNDPTDALTLFREAEQVESTWWQPYYDQARAELALGDQSAAGRALARSLQLDPMRGQAWQLKSQLGQAERKVKVGTSGDGGRSSEG
jgi:tetratricopeptide (TPR) repeat protein